MHTQSMKQTRRVQDPDRFFRFFEEEWPSHDVAVRTYRIAGVTIRLEESPRKDALPDAVARLFQDFEAASETFPDILVRVLVVDGIEDAERIFGPHLPGHSGRSHDDRGGRELWLGDTYFRAIPSAGGGPVRLVGWVQRGISGERSFLAEALATYLDENESGLLFHAGAVAHRGEALVLAGRSEIGKSTAVRLRPSGTVSLGDECVVLHRKGATWLVSPTPFGGQAERSLETVPLKAVGLLTKGGPEAVQPIAPRSALALFAHVIFLPGNNALAILADLAQQVPFYKVVRGDGPGFWSLLCVELGWNVSGGASWAEQSS